MEVQTDKHFNSVIVGIYVKELFLFLFFI